MSAVNSTASDSCAAPHGERETDKRLISLCGLPGRSSRAAGAESDLPGEETLPAKTGKCWNAPLKGLARATCLDLKSLSVCVVRFGLSMFDYRLKLNPCRERRDR